MARRARSSSTQVPRSDSTSDAAMRDPLDYDDDDFYEVGEHYETATLLVYVLIAVAAGALAYQAWMALV